MPDVSFGGVPNPNPTFKALSDLAGQLNGAVLMGHSQSGPFPLAAALLNPAVAKGLVLVEPGRCPANYTDEQIKTLATIPDAGRLRRSPRHADRHRDSALVASSLRELSGAHRSPQERPAVRRRCSAPPRRGIHGNSHMIMQDKNNLQIADLILKWIDERVSKRSGGAK